MPLEVCVEEMVHSVFWGLHLKGKVKTESREHSATLVCWVQADPCPPGLSSPESTPTTGPASSRIPKATENQSLNLQLCLQGQHRRAQHFNGSARSPSGPPPPPGNSKFK